MPKVWFIRKQQIMIVVSTLLVLFAAWYWWSADVEAPVDAAPDQPRMIHLVTGEFKTTTKDGKEIEAYRWDPGTIHVEKGEHVRINILGVNGESHPFFIEGTSIKGEVKKGEETIIDFKTDKEGVYRLICTIHPDKANNGPMIAYIVVD